MDTKSLSKQFNSIKMSKVLLWLSFLLLQTVALFGDFVTRSTVVIVPMAVKLPCYPVPGFRSMQETMKFPRIFVGEILGKRTHFQ